MGTKNKDNGSDDLAREKTDNPPVGVGILAAEDSGEVVPKDEGAAGQVSAQEGVATIIPREKFSGFKAVLAVAQRDDAPLIFDIVYQGKIYLVAFALAHPNNNDLVLSDMNEPLWAPLRFIGGHKVLQPMFGTTTEEVESCLASMKNYESGTHFLVMSNSIEVIQKTVRGLNIPDHVSRFVH